MTWDARTHVVQFELHRVINADSKDLRTTKVDLPENRLLDGEKEKKKNDGEQSKTGLLWSRSNRWFRSYQHRSDWRGWWSSPDTSQRWSSPRCCVARSCTWCSYERRLVPEVSCLPTQSSHSLFVPVVDIDEEEEEVTKSVFNPESERTLSWLEWRTRERERGRT